MSGEIDIYALAARLKAKRDKRGLRTVADEIGNVSASTLSRIEQGKVPDIDTFMRVCRWLEMSPDQFMANTTEMRHESGKTHTKEIESTPQKVAAYLRADRHLDPGTAEALVKMIELAYSAMERGEVGAPKEG